MFVSQIKNIRITAERESVSIERTFLLKDNLNASDKTQVSHKMAGDVHNVHADE